MNSFLTNTIRNRILSSMVLFILTVFLAGCFKVVSFTPSSPYNLNSAANTLTIELLGNKGEAWPREGHLHISAQNKPFQITRIEISSNVFVSNEITLHKVHLQLINDTYQNGSLFKRTIIFVSNKSTFSDVLAVTNLASFSNDVFEFKMVFGGYTSLIEEGDEGRLTLRVDVVSEGQSLSLSTNIQVSVRDSLFAP